MRSAYEVDMKFYRDAGTTTRVVWYFVPDGTPALPFPTAFWSRIYERLDNEPSPALGEQNAPIAWRGGINPGAEATGGLCGSALQWANGALTTDPTPGFWPGTSLPRCCDKLYDVSTGGAGLGSKVRASTCLGMTGLAEIAFLDVTTSFPACGAAPTAPVVLKWAGYNRIVFGIPAQIVYQSDPITLLGVPHVVAIVCLSTFPNPTVWYWPVSDPTAAFGGYSLSVLPLPSPVWQGATFPGQWPDCPISTTTLTVTF
jgi:hypothetical protein